MDISTLTDAAPTAIPIGILLSIMGWLWKLLANSEKRNGEFIDRINQDYDKDIRELKEEVKELRAEISRLTASLDQERELRRMAQEEAHLARMKQYDTTD
jgi:uncharacterized protein YlxW (UPF0749 family)